MHAPEHTPLDSLIRQHRRGLLRASGACLLAVLTQATLAAGTPPRLPQSRTLAYQVRSNRFPFWLKGELQWQHQDKRYQARLSYSLLGQSRQQSSEGLIGADGLKPLRFTDHRSQDLVVLFDQARARASFQDRAPEVVLQAGAQDRLSALLQLGLLAAQLASPPAVGQQVSMQTVGSAGADVWTWVLTQTPTLHLPGGELATHKWQRQPLRDQDQHIEMWLAPTLDWLPARIRISEPDGSYVDQQWSGD